MRPTPWLAAEPYRFQTPSRGSRYGDDYGDFLWLTKSGELRIVVSAADKEFPWDHVSVSLKNRCPNWPEMCAVKDLFWDPEECVIQYHPPRSEYRNFHPFCLHLWKPTGIEFPRPPAILVAPDINQPAAP